MAGDCSCRELRPATAAMSLLGLTPDPGRKRLPFRSESATLGIVLLAHFHFGQSGYFHLTSSGLAFF
jgi:hypothetical protein